MNTLYVFGDSFTQGHHQFERFPNYEKYKEYRGGVLFDLWPTILANKLGMNLENLGVSSSGNDDIFHHFCQNVDRIQKNDIVIIGWTFISRFMWSTENNKWFTIHGGPDESYKKFVTISNKTRREILMNRFNPIYEELIYNYEKIIDRLAKSIEFQVFYWSADNNLIYNLPDKNQRKYIISDLINNGETLFYEIFRRGGKTISQESNYVVEDLHLGESGHKIQGELFYNYIMNISNQPFEYVSLNERDRKYLSLSHLAFNYDPVRDEKDKTFIRTLI